MDLLLHLIRKHELDIYDIPIALITREYLEYLDLMKTLNLDVVGEFLVVAATLTQIKSRMLLPPDQTEEDEDAGADPREELVQRLIEYQKFKEASLDLKDQESLWIETYGHGSPEGAKQEQELVLINLNLMDLIGAFNNVLRRADVKDVHEITVETLSIKEKISEILELLETHSSVCFEDIFADGPSRSEVIVTFLALLEIIRLRLVRIEQTQRFETIRIRKAAAATPSGETPPSATSEHPSPEEP
jgi:segregation and condensation protein A